MAESAEPPFNQRDLIYAAARRLGTLTKEGKVRPQVTATALGLGPKGTLRMQRLLKGTGVLHWDESWRIYRLLGWINGEAVERELRAARRAAAEAEAAAQRARDAAERQRRGG